MSIFEIPIGPPISENILTYRARPRKASPRAIPVTTRPCAIITYHRENGEMTQPIKEVEATIPTTAPPVPEDLPDASSDTAAETKAILENIISIAEDFLRRLKDGTAVVTADTVRNLRMVEAHLLSVLNESRNSKSRLPDKEAIPLNQGTGATGRKRRRPSTPSSPSSSATARIGILNRKQARTKITITDPYSGGQFSGRTDGQSTVKNVEAHARASATANGADFLLSQSPKRGFKHVATTPATPPSQPVEQRRTPAGTSPALTDSPPSAPAPWYPVPTAYPPGTYTQASASAANTAPVPPPSTFLPAWYSAPAVGVNPSGMFACAPYHSPYPLYLTYGYFPSPQPR